MNNTKTPLFIKSFNELIPVNPFLIFFLLSVVTLFQCQAQNDDFVYLEGKQFKLNEKNFYPMAMNYMVDIIQKDSTTFYPAPNHHYYTPEPNIDVLWECENKEDCYADLVKDFITIRNMGFNSLRLIGFQYKIKFNDEKNGNIGKDNPLFLTFNYSWQIKEMPLSPENYTLLFDQYRTVLKAAEEADLKVQFLTGGDGVAMEKHRLSYVQFLEALASEFATNTTLYSYDFTNEPLYNDMGHFSKGEVCEVVNEWNNTIHNNAPNHLTTIGQHGSKDIYEWDPRFLKLDFLSFHIYPVYKDVWIPNFDQALNIVKSEIKWLSENIEQPWIIGETGFTASSLYQGNFPLHGNLEDQRIYVEETLNTTLSCGGSGYSWWMYRDIAWSVPEGNPSRNYQNYYGMVDHHNNFKPAASAIQSFDPNNSTDECTTPSNYFNFQNNTLHTQSGKIIDQNGTPIKDALITAWETENWVNSKTFSDENGEFNLWADHNIDKIMYSATGANIKTEYDSYSNTIVLNRFPSSIEMLDLDTNSTKYYHEVSGIIYPNCDKLDDILAGNFNENTTNQLRIFPNPSEGLCTITLTNDLIKQIQIIDTHGNLLIQIDSVINNKITLDQKGLSKGFYFLNVLSAKGHTFSEKLIIK